MVKVKKTKRKSRSTTPKKKQTQKSDVIPKHRRQKAGDASVSRQNAGDASVSRQKAGDASVSRKRQRNSSSDLDKSVRQVKVSSSSTTRWRSPSANAISCAMNLIDTNIELTLNAVEAEDFEDVQNMLQQLKEKLKRRFTSLPTPPTHIQNYATLPTSARFMDEQLGENIEKKVKIEKEIDHLEILIDELEEEKEKLDAAEKTHEDTDIVEEPASSSNDATLSALRAVISCMERDV